MQLFLSLNHGHQNLKVIPRETPSPDKILNIYLAFMIFPTKTFCLCVTQKN